MKSKESKKLGTQFGVPILGTTMPEKSLRKIAYDQGIPMLVFEGGEAARLHEESIEVGFQGILNILSYLEMIDNEWQQESPLLSSYFSKTKWIRAPASGLLTTKKDIISSIAEDQLLAEISDPFGMEKTMEVHSNCKGIIFAKTTAPMVNEGDPLFHICMH
jgi:predicted deacylase